MASESASGPNGELRTRKLARENPEAVRAVAEKADDQLRERLLEILAEEGRGEA